MEGRAESDMAMALSKLALPRFVVHRVRPTDLQNYLNGTTVMAFVLSETSPQAAIRPDDARLVGIYQEDVAHTPYGNEKPTHAEYRVVWERLT